MSLDIRTHGSGTYLIDEHTTQPPENCVLGWEVWHVKIRANKRHHIKRFRFKHRQYNNNCGDGTPYDHIFDSDTEYSNEPPCLPYFTLEYGFYIQEWERKCENCTEYYKLEGAVDIYFEPLPMFSCKVSTIPNVVEAGETSPSEVTVSEQIGLCAPVHIKATPKPGYKFIRWYGPGISKDNENLASTSISVCENCAGVASPKQYIAQFQERDPTDPPIDIDPTPTPPGPGPYPDPQPPPGTDPDDTKYSYIILYTSVNPDGVATSSSPTGTLYIGYPGSQTTLSCTSRLNSDQEANYDFKNWTGTDTITSQSTDGDGKGGSMTAVLTFPSTPGGTKVVTYTANYGNGEFYVETAEHPEGSGATFGGGYYNAGDECTVIAYPINSRFLRWVDENGDTVSEDECFTFTVTEDVTYIALFHPWTMLILRDPDTGVILRNSNGIILRDGDPEQAS